MGNTCCSPSEHLYSPSIKDSDFAKVRLKNKQNTAQISANKENQISNILRQIFQGLKRVDEEDYRRISDFIQVNYLQVFSHYANQQIKAAAIDNQKKQDDDKKQEGNINDIQNRERYFCGRFQNGSAQGLGLYYVDKNYYYLGNFQDGAISGQGLLHIFHNKDQDSEIGIFQEYQGKFLDGKAHGHGKYIKKKQSNYNLSYENEIQFIGQWLGGSPITGSAKFGPSSNVKNLEILDIKTREGIIYLANGDNYKGHLSEKLQPDGIGIYKSTHFEYSGNWQAGKFHGFGKFIWQTGQKYQGNYSFGKKQGQGKFNFKSGKYYEGNWVQGKQNGRGILYSQSGNILKRGLWANGKLQIEIPDQEWDIKNK